MPTTLPLKLGDVVVVVVRDALGEVIGQAAMTVVGRRVARPGRRASAGVVVSPVDPRAHREIERLRSLVAAPRQELARFDNAPEATTELRAVATGGVGLFPIDSVVAARAILAFTVVSPDGPTFAFTAEAAFFVDSNKKRFVAVRAASELERVRVEEHVKHATQLERGRVSA